MKTCKVCKKQFRELYSHICKRSAKNRYKDFNYPTLIIMTNDVKQDHMKAFARVKKAVKRREQDINVKCLCGGDIYAYHWLDIKTGSISVETFCQNCGFLWDTYGQEVKDEL